MTSRKAPARGAHIWPYQTLIPALYQKSHWFFKEAAELSEFTRARSPLDACLGRNSTLTTRKPPGQGNCPSFEIWANWAKFLNPKLPQ
jgi:hypothetical protein